MSTNSGIADSSTGPLVQNSDPLGPINPGPNGPNVAAPNVPAPPDTSPLSSLLQRVPQPQQDGYLNQGSVEYWKGQMEQEMVRSPIYSIQIFN